MSDKLTEKVSLNKFIYGKYLDKHNLAVVKVKWIEDKKTGLMKPHVWTIKRKDY